MTSAAYELAVLVLAVGGACGWYASRAYAARGGWRTRRSPDPRGWRQSGLTAFLIAVAIVVVVVRVAHHFHHPL